MICRCRLLAFDHVEIDEPERTNTSRSQVERERGAQTACADAKHARGLQSLLALHADFRQDEVARVAGEIVGAELG